MRYESTEKVRKIEELFLEYKDKEESDSVIFLTKLRLLFGEKECSCGKKMAEIDITPKVIEETADRIIEEMEFSNFLENNAPSEDSDCTVSSKELRIELGINEQTLISTKNKLGITGKKIGRSVFFTQAEAERIRAFPFRKKGGKNQKVNAETSPEKKEEKKELVHEGLQPVVGKEHDIRCWISERDEWYHFEDLSYHDVKDYIDMYGSGNVEIIAVR